MIIFAGIGLMAGSMALSAPVLTSIITPDFRLVESSAFGIDIRDRTGTTKVRGLTGYGWPQDAGGGRIVTSQAEGLYVLDAATGKAILIYDAREGRPSPDRFWICGEQILFAPRGKKMALYAVDLNSSEPRDVRNIPVASDRLNSLSGEPFGTGKKDGERFWLFRPSPPKTPLARIWEDGRMEEISKGAPVRFRSASYVNGLVLLQTADGLAVYGDRGAGFELDHRINGDFAYQEPWEEPVHEHAAVREIYGKHGNHIARLDLEAWELKDIAPLASVEGSQVYAYWPDLFVLLEQNPSRKTLSVSLIRDGRVDRVKTFAEYDLTQGNINFSVRRNGIVFRKGKTLRAYAFPDLEEIRLK